MLRARRSRRKRNTARVRGLSARGSVTGHSDPHRGRLVGSLICRSNRDTLGVTDRLNRDGKSLDRKQATDAPAAGATAATLLASKRPSWQSRAAGR
jgi:hypothetical protein